MGALEIMGWILTGMAVIVGAGYLVLGVGLYLMSRMSDHGPGLPPLLQQDTVDD